MELLKKSTYIPVLILFLFFTLLFFLLLIRGFIQSSKTPDLNTCHKSGLFKEKFTYSSYESIDDYLKEEKLFFDRTYKILGEVSNSDPKYLKGSNYNPQKYDNNLNRTSVTYPKNKNHIGAALVVHGLSDSPYHMNHIVRILQEEGYYVINLRLPGHGTAPGALVDIKWQDWMEAVEFGIDMAYKKSKESTDNKFTLIGFSTGGALLLRYMAKEVKVGGDRLPDNIFLFSPAVSITKQAYFADFHEYVSWLPGLEKFKWMDVLKEDDPFKYQSFPKNAANQIYKLTELNKKLINEIAKNTDLRTKIPQIIAFQSPYDATVEYKGLITLFYKLNNKNNKLILFKENSIYRDQYNNEYKSVINYVDFYPERFESELYIIKNITDTSSMAALYKASISDKGEVQYNIEDSFLQIPWPEKIFAMSHISPQISFTDPYYGIKSAIFPFQKDKLYGERGLLISENDKTFTRVKFNPFINIISQFIKENL